MTEDEEENIKLLDNLKETIRHWTFSKDAFHRTLWRSRFGRVYALLV